MFKGVFLVLHEANFYRQYKQTVAHLLAESLETFQAGGILFCGDDDLRRWHIGKRLVDAEDVFAVEVVVVGEGE